MTTSIALERLFNTIELSRGKGRRRDNELCLMSFVALLAGEPHGDEPKTASPFIRNFAVRLNDHLPDDQRQRLKYFAPRILGTRDHCDNQRVELMRAAFENEIVPRLDADGAMRWMSPAVLARVTSFAAEPISATAPKLSLIGRLRYAPDLEYRRAALAAADLLIFCVHHAPEVEQRDWYRTKMIELLDRICDVGRPAAAPFSVARAESLLEESRRAIPLVERITQACREIADRFASRRAEVLPPASTPYQIVKRPITARNSEWQEIWSISPAPIALHTRDVRPVPAPQKRKTPLA
ncbi:MAG: hypothetical protein QM688_05725 [Sphingomonas bacterium]